jgi:hypothetical protein
VQLRGFKGSARDGRTADDPARGGAGCVSRGFPGLGGRVRARKEVIKGKEEGIESSTKGFGPHERR